MNTSIISNTSLLDLFRSAARYYEIRGDEWRAKAYGAAVDALSGIDIVGAPLTEIAAVRGIGKSILGLIEEFRATGHIACIEKMLKSEEYVAWSVLSRVTGAGPATVAKWIAAGCRTPADVQALAARGQIKLTSMQDIGLTYYDDLTQRIPRAECEHIIRIVACAAKLVAPGARIVPAGSYRRGRLDSGDVDIMVVSPDAGAMLAIFERVEIARPVVRVMIGSARISFLIMVYQENPTNNKTGVRAKRVHRRQVDLLWVLPKNYWPALLYFTGGAEHVRGIRAICQSRGMRLNQDGLFKMVPTSVQHPTGLMPIPLSSERSLYDILGLDWVPPELR